MPFEGRAVFIKSIVCKGCKTKGLTFLFYPFLVLLAQNDTIPTSYRKIQLDGFLLEWNEAGARLLGNDSAVVWDARTTPEGIAGYFRYRTNDSCLPRLFRLGTTCDATLPVLEIMSNSRNDSLYRINLEATFSVIEWLVPWSRVHADSFGTVCVKLLCIDSCGDTARSYSIAPGYGRQGREAIRRLKLEIILIGMLLVAYLILRMQAKRKAPQSVSTKKI